MGIKSETSKDKMKYRVWVLSEGEKKHEKYGERE